MNPLIIIPAYNEEKNIGRVVDDIAGRFPRYDYVVINDCSTDGTERICRERGYNYLSLPTNLGIGGAVQCGYRYALDRGYELAVQLDGDGQHDPAYIGAVLGPILRDEADMVVGSRFLETGGFRSSAARRTGGALIGAVIRLCCGVGVTDATSGFRATNRKLIRLFAEEYAQDYPEPEAIVTAALRGFRISEVPVVMNERAGGRSSINGPRSAYYMLKVPLALIIYRISVKRRKIKEV